MFPLSVAELQQRFPDLYSASAIIDQDTALFMQRTPQGKRLVVLAPIGHCWLDRFSGGTQVFNDQHMLKIGPLDAANAHVLRSVVPNLNPVPLGLATSAGCGDRLGLATPGHVRAFNAMKTQAGAQPVAAIFMQQSIREMTRTNRTPADVMCDATWGAFEGGWRDRLGADADHLKTTDDIDACAAEGFSFYTIDPGAHVDSEADTAPLNLIKQKAQALRWADLETTVAEMIKRYAGRTFDLEDRRLVMSEEAAWRAAVKYGNAIAHVSLMYRYLVSKAIRFELEVSVDETDTPTSHAEHVFIVSELKRLGVQWVSLAPRYVGRFEKGVDYIGDLKELQVDLAGHAAIARAFGPYKLSLHSGSDKFGVYPLIVAATRGVVHLKTAGTSYLEALRAIARVNAPLFRELLALAIERYPTDRVSYHVSADVKRVARPDALSEAELPGILDQLDTREALHVTFGSALAQYGDDIRGTLRTHEDEHYAALEAYFIRHLTPFARR
ncbi:MAG TPA: tagaturonate epimerase family protein [Anaerolineae bacterium]|nr:tagaturonate epimerase family protein [Anaerolineae bacterium]